MADLFSRKLLAEVFKDPRLMRDFEKLSRSVDTDLPDQVATAQATANDALLAVSTLTVDDITDVDAPTPTDGQSLVWNSSTGKWEPETINDGVGVPAGGVAGQILTKVDGTDYNTVWHTGRTIDPSNYGYVPGMPDARASVQAALNAHTSGDVVVLNEDYNIPTGTLTLPAGIRIEGDYGRIIRTQDSKERLLVNPGNAGVKVSGLTLHTDGGAAASGAHTATTGSKAFTVVAGLNFSAADPVYVIAHPVGSLILYGTVTSYSGTLMTVNITSISGSGSSSTWRVGHADGEALALRDHAGVDSIYDNIKATGSWYVALELLNSDGCTIKNSVVTSAVNRAYYVYAASGTATGCRIEKNTIRGNSFTTYGINVNGSTAGTITNLLVDGNDVRSTVFQGISFGGNVQDSTMSVNNISGVLQGPSLMIQRANSLSPIRCGIVGNTAKSSGGQGVLVQDCFYSKVTSNSIASCTTGVHLDHATYASGNYYHIVNGNILNGNTSHGISVTSAGVNLCGNSIISNNQLISNTGTGLVTAANSYRNLIEGNFSIGNGTEYSISGTANSVGTNI